MLVVGLACGGSDQDPPNAVSGDEGDVFAAPTATVSLEEFLSLTGVQCVRLDEELENQEAPTLATDPATLERDADLVRDVVAAVRRLDVPEEASRDRAALALGLEQLAQGFDAVAEAVRSGDEGALARAVAETTPIGRRIDAVCSSLGVG